MPPKRKHQTPSKDSSFISDSPYSKRPRRTTANQSELAQTIYEYVKDYEDENNHLVAELFMKLPSKRQNPDYYEKIIDPVDLTKIGQRIKMDEYRDIEILTTDIQLMISNAKKYYEEETPQYNDACLLWEIYLNAKSRVLEEAKSSESVKLKSGRKEIDISVEDLKELFENLVTETDESGRVIADMFMQLPDKSNIQYYEVIKDPIDFQRIGDKLEDGQYKSISELQKDIMLLVKNAKTFNQPHSQIYDDAVTIKSMFHDRVADLEKSKRPELAAVKSTSRLKSRKSFGRISERLQEKSAPKQEDFKMDLHEASISNPGDNDWQALLFNDIVNYKNHLGHTISDPFVRLPNKRFYPMYYDEIENPISLKMIRKKIMSKKYESCEDLCEDLDLLFSNAKQFNISTSQIHKDASTLKKFMDSKLPEYTAKEEEEVEEMSESSEEEASVEKAENDGLAAPEIGQAEVEPKKIKRRKRRKTIKDILQNRLQLLFDYLLEAKDENGREMISLFLEKPSRKDYPDYYKLVLEPIDMKMIGRKIRHDRYMSVDDMLEDFDLMFNNARHYNEPGSEVYRDADALEKMLLEKNRELDPLPSIETAHDKNASRSSKKINRSAIGENFEKLFTAVRDYIDPTQRMICEIFMHLPTKQELPDYYKVIKKPIDMDRIQQRMQMNQYIKLDEMLADMLLMFENACTYNEPGSMIYKDALILQKVAVEKFQCLDKNDGILSPEHLVQEMLISLFMSVMGHQDESGRCYSESFTTSASESKKPPPADQQTSVTQSSEDAVAMETDESSESSLSLEIIKKNLHNRRYRRLDVFQKHMFQVFEEARSRNRTDSEIYEDAVELQKFFIKIRDELCKNGETLMSPALLVTGKRLENEVETEKREKLTDECKEDDKLSEEGKEIRDKMNMSSQSDGMDHEGTTYKIGDFVYVDNSDNKGAPHVVNIEKLYTNESGQRMLFGFWLYRPEATFHMASKKFFLKEVFKSDYYNAVPVSLIRGKCFVMMSKDYFKMKPVGFKEDDIYVIESRYSSRSKSFKRLKQNQWPPNDVELVPRDTPLPMFRISSCYSDQKVKEESSAADEMRTMLMQDIEASWPTDVIDVKRKNIEADGPVFSEAVHYIQYCVGEMCIKLGDCLYLQQPNSSSYKIARVERLWTDPSGKVWFYGPWFIRPEDTEHEPTRMFYNNELFISCSDDTFMFSNVVGKCVVLYIKDYVACRPTEVAEKDIFLYESKYLTNEKQIKKIKSAKRYTPTYKVVDDEYYYYKRSLPLENVLASSLIKIVEEELRNRDEEHKLMKTKPEEVHPDPPNPVPNYAVSHPISQHPDYPTAAPVPAYGQPPAMIPGQPYYPHPIPQPFMGSPPTSEIHHSVMPPQTYMQPHYAPQGAPYPPTHSVIPPPAPHGEQYRASPQVYSQSPHPSMVVPSPGIQSPDESRPSSARSEVAPTPPTKKKSRVGHSTGYILFASYYHPKVRAEHPEMPFGEISKIVGEEWRNLEDDKKKEYEEKAKEQTAKAEAEGRLIVKKKKKKKDVEDPPTPAPSQLPHPAVATPQQYTGYQPGQYPPMPGQPHMTQRTPIPPQPGTPHAMQPYMQTPTGATFPPQQATPTQPPPTIAQQHRNRRGALFLKPPPKAQRVMHSEAYLRYIEGLERGSKSVSNWERTVKVKENDVHLSKEEEQKLPVHWLGNDKGRYETTTSALWALRDLLLKDALAIKNNFS